MEDITIYLNSLVDNYRHGGPGASEALLEAFEPLRGKYFKLLTTGIFDNRDRDLAHFLSMLGNGNLYATARSLSNAVKVSMGPEDLSQELALCIFETALRYYNISSTYKYAVKERMKNLLKETIYYETAEPEDIDRIKSNDSEEIGEDWIEGEAASELWQNLTQTQREIVKIIYVDGYNSLECSKMLNIPLSILRKEEKEARRILATAMGREDLLPIQKGTPSEREC